ncbi:MAG: hypothetical protein ETSY2_34830 [Candidatus Entotheonella gemina]|uniref:Uncharacterized protein n=1 Tax=Candidatus Entotheonella gemina TaxID=1429439 RepID=W4LZE9_9BACT|nr:MAG: hypothetical protein ETSY2_34830 [Candidatus Entotheonella gemina]
MKRYAKKQAKATKRRRLKAQERKNQCCASHESKYPC